ncbi:hypothetical protein [Streptomyces sp. NPDC001635]
MSTPARLVSAPTSSSSPPNILSPSNSARESPWNTWWRGKDSLIALYRGEAVGLEAPQCLEAHVYGGLDAWGLHGG